MTVVSNRSLFSLLSDLIAYPTESSQQQVSEECLKYVAEFLLRRGMEVKLHNSKGFPSLVATSRSAKKPKVLLQAHLDVVPAKAGLYSLTEKDGKLYGRGVYDMKFAVACYMQLVEELKDELNKYDIGIMLTADEELGGENGVKYLLQQGHACEVCILPDGGNDWCLETSHNGVWHIKLSASGSGAHGSRPWEGENAIDKLTATLNDIHALYGELNEQRCSMTVSQIQGGTAVNQVPDSAWATIDMRFISNEHHVSRRKEVEKIAKDHGVGLETLAEEPAASLDAGVPLIKSFLKTAEKVTGSPIGQCRSLGSTDGRYFTARGIPAIVIRPTGGGHHGPNEWIDKAELETFYEVLKAYVVKSAKV